MWFILPPDEQTHPAKGAEVMSIGKTRFSRYRMPGEELWQPQRGYDERMGNFSRWEWSIHRTEKIRARGEGKLTASVDNHQDEDQFLF